MPEENQSRRAGRNQQKACGEAGYVAEAQRRELGVEGSKRPCTASAGQLSLGGQFLCVRAH